MAPIVGVSAKALKLGTYKSDGSNVTVGSNERSWMQEIVLGCWTTLLADSANVGCYVDNDNYSAPAPLMTVRSVSC